MSSCVCANPSDKAIRAKVSPPSTPQRPSWAAARQAPAEQPSLPLLFLVKLRRAPSTLAANRSRHSAAGPSPCFESQSAAKIKSGERLVVDVASAMRPPRSEAAPSEAYWRAAEARARLLELVQQDGTSSPHEVEQDGTSWLEPPSPELPAPLELW
eukprot:scaffold20755_cov136-Isochrysis_galbana.AAC.6